jgi:glycosyltransferase involved in cell wall biosynthesis
VHWPRGVDATVFHPRHRRGAVYAELPGPIWLYVGRVAVEKNLEDFLDLPLPGTKVVVGDGPDVMAALPSRYCVAPPVRNIQRSNDAGFRRSISRCAGL